MSVTATYTDATAKVTVTVAAPANAQTVLLERSTDQITWSSVRGTQPLTLTGGAVSLDDYEFADGLVNYYRATYYDSTTPAAVGTPAAAAVTTSAGASASVTPALPTGLSVGATVFVSVANTKATAVLPAAPTGWTQVATDADGLGIYAADWTASLTAPTLTVTGLASGDKVVANAVAIRNVSPVLANADAIVNTSSANITTKAFVGLGANAGVMAAFIRSINTSVSPAATVNSTGTGYSLLTYIHVPATATAGSITVTGGSAATSSVLYTSMQARAFVSQEVGNVTPALSRVWMKNPIAPYLNVAVTVISIDDITNPARTGVFDIIGRMNPVAVTDVYGSDKTTIGLRTTDDATMEDLRSRLKTGQVQFIHAPKGSRTPTGYFVLGDLDKSFPSSTGTARRLSFPATGVAAPDPSVAAVISTYQTVINDYATYAALIAAKATYADVLLLVGSPSDVITG